MNLRLTILFWAAAVGCFAESPQFDEATVHFDSSPAPAATMKSANFCVVATAEGPQVAVTEFPTTVLVSLEAGQTVDLTLGDLGRPDLLDKMRPYFAGALPATAMAAGSSRFADSRTTSPCRTSLPRGAILAPAVSALVISTRFGAVRRDCSTI